MAFPVRRMLPIGAVAALALALVGVGLLRGQSTPAHAASSTSQAVCIGHHPQQFVWYTSSCTGHDEPEIDPLSSRAGSAQDLTWTIVLPTNGAVQVDAVGPTFWIGGTVSDPTSLNGQAFLEVQFYPNSLVTGCASNGGYNVSYAANTYGVCSPVWKVNPKNNAETAAFNAMLTDNATGGALVMHAGDTITDHQYSTPAADGMHITVTDVTTGHSGTIILNSASDGPLMPAYSVQKLGNALGWGWWMTRPTRSCGRLGTRAPIPSQPASSACQAARPSRPATPMMCRRGCNSRRC